jgi:hypothetical protein
MRFIFPIGALLLIIVSGCNKDNISLVKMFTPPEDEAKATNYVAMLRQGRFEQLENDMDGSIKTGDVHGTLVKIAALIPPQQPISVKVVGAEQFHSQGVNQIYLTFEYQFPTNWLIINVALQRNEGACTIYGLSVRPLSNSLENINRFTLSGKNVIQYTILALAVSVPMFIVYALVLCIRTRMRKRKWLWIIFILIGVGKFTVNWTTGQWEFGFLQVQLLGASAFAPPYGAWLIAVSVPLGAVLFLLRRKRLTAPVEP